MVRNNSIEHKKKKPKLESLAKESDESTLTQKSKEFAKHAEISIGHPLHSAKATSFSPLSSTDTSVHADSPILTATHLGSQKVCHSKNEKEMLQTCVIEKRGEFKDEIKNDKKTNLDTDESCNVKTCPMEVYSREICGTHLNTSIKHDSEDKISPMISPIKLTEMINTSIKEAMKTIVKQCRMGEERDLDKKSEKDLVESVSRVNKEAIPTKVKQPRVTRKQFNNHSGISKPGTNLEKSHEGAAKRYGKRGNASEKIKKKYSKSPNNVKTDNRKMTGNVNIYICSEATENTQAASKQEKSETCTESSSTTTTEESKISSSKLLASIRNKRRKFEERDSFDLPEREESNNSIAYSNLSKYMDSKSAIKSESSNFIDIRNNLDNDVRIKNIESTSTECKCKDTNISDTIVTIDKSDLSFEKSKFVICDALEKPFDFGRTKTIYPVKSSSLSESEEWSSKSACSSRNLDCVLSNTWSLEPNLNRIAESEKRRVSLKTLESVCKCLKKDQELIDRYNLRCNCRNKKYSIKTVEKEPLICNCITEEEEDDVCVNVATSREFEKSAEAGKQQITTCRKISADVKESAMLVPSTEHSTDLHSSPKLNEKDTKTLEQDKNEEKLKIDKTEISDEDKSSEKKKAEQFHGTQEMDQRPKETRHNIPKFVAFPKLVRPEVITLKHLLQLRNPEKAIEHKDVSPTSVKPSNSLEQSVQDTKLKVRSQVSPKILRKFNLPKESTFPEQPTVEEKQPSSEAKGKEVLDEKSSKEKLAEKALESKNDTKNQTARNLQGKLRGSFLFKSFKKITGKAEHSETKTDEFMKKDNKIAERISSDADTDKNLQIPKTEAEKLPVKPKIEIKETYKQNGKFIPSKMYSHIPKINESKPESDTVNLTKSPTNEGNKKDKKNDSIVSPSKSIGKEVEQEAKDETISDDSEKKQTKSKSLINIDSKTPPVSSTKGIDSELSKQENTEKDEKLDESRKIVKNREFHESLKKPQFEKKSDIEGKRKSALQITKTRRETPVKIAYDTHCEQASIAVDTYSSKLISSSHTVCSNSNYAKCASANDCISMEKNTCNYCNCCYLPILQCDNEHINYPKSCLKMERQCCHTVSQENNRPILYHDKRNWEECGCRRIISCNTCCKARNDCRLTVACVNCYKPKNKCNCKSVRETKMACKCMKSMFCLYCDNPRDKCTCRAPMRKCSCCKLTVDLCICKDQKTIYDGRPVLTEPGNDHTMYVTAWKPREEVRRYFSRNLTDHKTDSMNECCYCEKLKSRNSDDLPYQRLSVFSDVMDELQKKISESTCCARCKKIPCCCNIAVEKDEKREDRMIKYRISPKARRKIIAVCMETSKNKLLNNCKCESSYAKGDKQKKIIVALCCACKSAPCRCKKIKSNQKKPKAKCYYCKSSPCICIAASERNKSRPCRCTDSPCQTKEKESTSHGKTSTKSKNYDEKTICLR